MGRRATLSKSIVHKLQYYSAKIAAIEVYLAIVLSLSIARWF